jgi:hypothetical protein
MPSFMNLVGRQFGRLTVLERDLSGKKQIVKYRCQCQCGKILSVDAGNLRSGHTTSCGCYRKEFLRITHTKHNSVKTRLYKIWANMLDRCRRPNSTFYKEYGGRGIKVCDEWRQFENFRDWALENGYNDTLTIDRIDVNRNYAPDNCRWATLLVQSRNKRNNLKITFCGETKTVSEWSEITKIPRQSIARRFKSGWNIDDVLKKIDRRIQRRKEQ